MNIIHASLCYHAYIIYITYLSSLADKLLTDKPVMYHCTPNVDILNKVWVWVCAYASLQWSNY